MGFRLARGGTLVLAVTQLLGGFAFGQIGAPMPPAGKLFVPEFEVRAKLHKEIRQLYEDEYADTARDKQIALGKKLLDLAQESTDPTRFVLLVEANTIATRQCDLETAFRTCDELSMYHGKEFNLHSQRNIVLSVAFGRESERNVLRDNQLQHAFIDLCRASGWEAIRDDETELGGNMFKLALALADVMYHRGLVSKEWNLQLNQEATDLTWIHVELRDWKWRSLAPAGSRDDARLNLQGGTVRCLGQNRWEDGLPLLAAGKDEDLAVAAKEDLTRRTEADYRANGDLWWTLAEKYQGLKRQNMRDRASYWYERAMANLKDDETRKLVRQRIKEVLGAVRKAPDTYSQELPLLMQRREFTAKDRTPIPMLPAEDGFCFLTAIGGPWNATGELGIAINQDGQFTLVSHGSQPQIGRAMALTEMRWRTEFQPEITEVSWKGGPPVKLLSKNDGLAVLSFVGGRLDKDAEVGVTLSEDGDWYLGGKGEVTAKALVIKSNRSGSFHAFVREHGWEVGQPAATLLKRDQGFCFLSWIGGAIETGEEVQIWLDGDYWLLSGRAAQRSLRARAISVRVKRFADE